LNKRTGNFHSGFIFLGCVMLAAAALSLGLKTASGDNGRVEGRLQDA
jgi:hypothetical protein